MEKKKYIRHLKKVSKELDKYLKEIKKDDDAIQGFEQRLHYIIRGVDPKNAKCSIHKTRITKNDFGEFICGDCIEESIYHDFDQHDENNWFAPDDEPEIKITGIRYGFKLPE
jgi:SMC interacting uncharacterized protein involved in chromosome segregation